MYNMALTCGHPLPNHIDEEALTHIIDVDPGTPIDCPECGITRQINVHAQAEMYGRIFGPTQTPET